MTPSGRSSWKNQWAYNDAGKKLREELTNSKASG